MYVKRSGGYDISISTTTCSLPMANQEIVAVVVVVRSAVVAFE